ncbi:MAG: Z1 domain-containing protein [bacterium]|nr:Z1 domain-containing protein [bacterium]
MISQLLNLLPRAQYVGYTATPFANVFIDPQDSEDIFPKDFIIALVRPNGYMGASDFHDLDPTTDENDLLIENNNERAYIRNLVAPRDDVTARANELREALGMFVLTGAIKRYRMANGSDHFRHHTMLVHESVRRDHHRVLAEEIAEIWDATSFSSPSGLGLLRRLWLEDVVPTWQLLNLDIAPITFDELKPYIGLAISAITDTGNPVIVVNSDRDIESEDVDFDKRPVWRILVGGAKLSRGFTIEGLTISYYRRRTGSGDTLMQMGRWFGFRRGYQDLVRLYIDREVQAGRRTVDLYDAFGAIMRAEELFRSELAKYSVLVDGKPQIRPAQVPPLVTQHLPWLRPTAPNKMFNARLHRRRMDAIEPVAYPKIPEDIVANYDIMKPLVAKANQAGEFQFPNGSIGMHYGVVSHSELLERLHRLRWCVEDHFAADLAYLDEMSDSVQDWVVLLPQRRQGPNCVLPELGRECVFLRKRSRDPLFQAISDPKHRSVPQKIARVPVARHYEDPLAEQLSTSGPGALLVYPMVEEQLKESPDPIEIAKRECFFGMHIVPPYLVRRRDLPYVEFQVQNLALADEVIVPGPGQVG